jgi:hypothetical protein
VLLPGLDGYCLNFDDSRHRMSCCHSDVRDSCDWSMALRITSDFSAIVGPFAHAERGRRRFETIRAARGGSLNCRAAAGLGLILLHHASSRIRCCRLRAANENVLDKHKATRLKPITTGPSLAPPGSVPARISHTNRRIGPPNQRKFLCRNDFTQVRGAPEEIGRDGAGVEAELNRPGTVDHGVKCRTVDLVLQVRIGNPILLSRAALRR